jgi:hypothetical protein
MEGIKKPLSLQLKAEDFLPADESEKQQLVIMRESTTFWKDAMKRLCHNKVAMSAFFCNYFDYDICICSAAILSLFLRSANPRK